MELIDFVDLTLKERLIALNWRNSDEIKKWMYLQNAISTKTHLDFIDELQFSKERQYLLVKKENNYVGAVYFTGIDFDKNQYYFELYYNPFDKMKGVGRLLQEACIKYAFNLLGLNKLKLEVFASNLRAINLYKRFNFIKTSEKIVNRKKVDCLELQR